jgi:hypothetical protein
MELKKEEERESLESSFAFFVAFSFFFFFALNCDRFSDKKKLLFGKFRSKFELLFTHKIK